MDIKKPASIRCGFLFKLYLKDDLFVLGEPDKREFFNISP